MATENLDSTQFLKKKIVTESCDAVFFEGSEGCGDKCRRLNGTCPVRLLVQPLALKR